VPCPPNPNDVVRDFFSGLPLPLSSGYITHGVADVAVDSSRWQHRGLTRAVSTRPLRLWAPSSPMASRVWKRYLSASTRPSSPASQRPVPWCGSLTPCSRTPPIERSRRYVRTSPSQRCTTNSAKHPRLTHNPNPRVRWVFHPRCDPVPESVSVDDEGTSTVPQSHGHKAPAVGSHAYTSG
jgi:hypothetical protein